MTKPNDGGPAFPHAQKPDPGNPRRAEYLIGGGMSLRAYFAGKALVGILAAGAHPSVDPSSHPVPAVTAKSCCKIADALIAELEGKDAEIQAPDEEAFKFELEQKVRLRQREPYRFDENEGVVKERSWTAGRGIVYRLAVLVDGKRCSVWISEDKLERAPKFKEGDSVRVASDVHGRVAGMVGVVYHVLLDLAGQWKYMIEIPDGKGVIRGKYTENRLEAVEEGAKDEG